MSFTLEVISDRRRIETHNQLSQLASDLQDTQDRLTEVAETLSAIPALEVLGDEFATIVARMRQQADSLCVSAQYVGRHVTKTQVRLDNSL